MENNIKGEYESDEAKQYTWDSAVFDRWVIILEGKISRTSIYRSINLNKLKAIKVGKRYLINETALNNFLTGNYAENE